jgi:MinD-like ATPase involved in chromosome partitioning or flagellar assembly
MIPSDIRLYTWIDVEDVLLRRQKEKNWPDWLVWGRAYFDGLHLGIKKGTQDEAREWLAEQFAPRVDIENDRILLESAKNQSRTLPVFWEETEETPPVPRTVPSLARPTVILRPYDRQFPDPLPEEYPPIIAFHSFKGGVGRTLHALSLAITLTKNKDKKSRILLIDGDLEAPGLTWLLHSRIPSPPISLVDLWALVHGDPNPEAGESINLAADRIKDMLLDGIYVLPAFRTLSQFNNPEVRPEHLVKSAVNPYIIKKVLATLGKILEVDAVIVDLRAGLSELSTGLLLDPEVYRVIVTTLSAQSIEGTCHLLKLLCELETPRRKDDPLPSIIITQIPKDDSTVSKSELKILEAFSFWNNDMESDESESMNLNLLHSPFNYSLIVLPDNWDDLVKVVNKSEVPERLNPLRDWLPANGSEIATGSGNDQDLAVINKKRSELDKLSQNLIFAEKSIIRKFLSFSPLRNLASDFRNRAPIAVVVGAKGSGKTYTYIQTALRGNWDKFVSDAIGMETEFKAHIAPVLHSQNIKAKTLETINKLATVMAGRLGGRSTAVSQQILDYLRDNLKNDLHEGQWRDRWLDVIAWKCGFNVGQENAGKELNNFLKSKEAVVVAIIDGLEDLFQSLSSKESQQTALRSLLQDVPDWLEQQPYRHLGLIVFVRQDMVFNSVKQNPAQLISKYSPYNLKWDSIEALRLAAWISIEAGVLLLKEEKVLQNMEKDELSELLVELWGRKLGSDRSNEARSAEWVISVLSDLKGQIQARDVVRLLNQSAVQSQRDTYWRHRILTPRSIRDAVDYCSVQKISEIELENIALGEILRKLKTDTDVEMRKIPFTREDVKLETEEISILEHNGVILKEKEVYYMPEIFRRGLDFKLKGGARPRVIYLQRRVSK